ncbi:hypothetical protein QBC42DRAFT_76229 [Cladorrhinum samala]|uniref:Secreted protein n=1 Tax=Cladorrhinum samala TaxID=585594 RepID=A0AAV9HS29_9PEZI|nr:hypothetical protein QBC42DRAFT_76229 [Cladorrhinum samala]
MVRFFFFFVPFTSPPLTQSHNRMGAARLLVGCSCRLLGSSPRRPLALLHVLHPGSVDEVGETCPPMAKATTLADCTNSSTSDIMVLMSGSEKVPSLVAFAWGVRSPLSSLIILDVEHNFERPRSFCCLVTPLPFLSVPHRRRIIRTIRIASCSIHPSRFVLIYPFVGGGRLVVCWLVNRGQRGSGHSFWAMP